MAEKPHLRRRADALAALVGGVLAGLLVGHGAVAAETRTYKWVDDQGVTHYGDRIPPQYATKERSILNNHGIEVQKLEAQKSPEQLAADAQRQQEIVRQKQHDSFLLTTYTSVKDIEALRDERLEQLKAQRTAAQQYIEGLRSRLTSLQSRALLFRPYSTKPGARRLPDDVAENLVRTVNEMRIQADSQDAKAQEETVLRNQFQADIERYKALHPAVTR
ncbi:MAG TPA: DUF4124 domain-containing protein [Steroidobacteraceae bacterium]|jgi:hypothetical protein